MSDRDELPPSRRGLLKLGSAAAAGATALWVSGATAAAASTAGISGTAAGAAAAATARTAKFAPLPTQAKPLPVGPDGYRLDRVGPEMYAVTANGNQSAFVVSSKGVILLDAPPSLATALPAAIKKVTNKRVTHLVYSHHHADHIANAAAFGDIVRIAHEDTAALIKIDRDPRRPMPTRTFKDRYTLTVGNQRLELSYPGPNHEAGNIIIHAPRQRTVMMIDVVIPGWAPFRAWGTADSVPGILRAHDALVKLDFDTFIGGHVHRLGTAKDVRLSREFTYDMWNLTAAKVAETPTADYFAQVETGNNWAAFQLWFEAVADKVEPIIRAKWLSRLAGVDVSTRENIITIALAQMLDSPRDF